MRTVLVLKLRYLLLYICQQTVYFYPYLMPELCYLLLLPEIEDSDLDVLLSYSFETFAMNLFS